jgi:EpsD family peptidyl-prolyl cis-trans isomerase
MKYLHPLRLPAALLATSLLLGLSACGNKESKTTATQVAAKVGSEEISVHQINQVLSRSNTAGATPQAVQTMSREVLEKLIDQQLAVEQATEAKLHRSPDVVTQIEAARRDILARAYMQQLSASLPKPSPEEAKKYFADNPQLFSQRRIFNVQEIVLPSSPGMSEQLRTQIAAGKPMEEIANWLKSQNIQFSGGAATRAAEQISLEMLPQVHALKDGGSLILSSPPNITVLRLLSSQSAPVKQADALSRIEQFLTNQRVNAAITANLKELRAKTTISYLGEFALAAAAPASAASAASPVASAENTANQPVEPAKPVQTAIEKGVAGLK